MPIFFLIQVSVNQVIFYFEKKMPEKRQKLVKLTKPLEVAPKERILNIKITF